NRECSLDIVPVDYVANSVATLVSSPEAAGRCYHLAAGVAGAVTIEQLVTLICGYFHGPPRRYVDPRGPVRWLGRAARLLLRGVSPGFVRQVERYLPYALQNPSFDTTNARAAGLAPPPFATYFPRILAYAHAADFGRGEARLPAAALSSPERPGPPAAAASVEQPRGGGAVGGEGAGAGRNSGWLSRSHSSAAPCSVRAKGSSRSMPTASCSRASTSLRTWRCRSCSGWCWEASSCCRSG